jgi:hypothetical protein
MRRAAALVKPVDAAAKLDEACSRAIDAPKVAELDRYSERKESAEELSKRVNQRSL